jgi:L,D-transpeptidase YcbB
MADPKMMRRVLPLVAGILFAAIVAFSSSSALAGDVPESILSVLKAQTPKNACGRRESALRGTLERLAGMSIPTEGRLILVNIASRSLAAYEDGNPVLESRVVIGKEGWRTPDLSTTVDYVRLNPTWTVPESIVKANRWRAKLASNPSYFARNGFDVVVRGRAVDPRDIADSEVAGATFVQRPAKDNALGRIKIGLVNSGGIYLHDTNDKAAYDRKGVESHGCIRAEAISELAAWILGKDKVDIAQWLDDDDRSNRKPVRPVRVVVGYFTAWPDAESKVHYFSDIYNRDPRNPSCAAGGSAGERRRSEG